MSFLYIYIYSIQVVYRCESLNRFHIKGVKHDVSLCHYVSLFLADGALHLQLVIARFGGFFYSPHLLQRIHRCLGTRMCPASTDPTHVMSRKVLLLCFAGGPKWS